MTTTRRRGSTGQLQGALRRARSEIVRLRRQAFHDPLTGLPNRALFQARLEDALEAARSSRQHVAVILMDLDDFKQVNDTLGHHAGDAVLAQLAPRFAEVIRGSDTVARLGGDEFGVVLRGAGAAAAMRAAEQLLKMCEADASVDGQPIAVGASVGIALYPDHGQDAADLVRAADVAMYSAKHMRTGVSVYSAGHDARSSKRIVLTAQLRRAIGTDQLRLYYQPLVSLTSPDIIGVEALLRWEHPTRGLLAPDEFLPAAERAGLMRAITFDVLRKALRQYRAWHEQGISLPVLVNLTPRDLLDQDFVARVRELHDEFRVSPLWLKLEITEGSVIADPERAIDTLARLREMGIRIAIDDFGTGYSSLSYLARLPVDAVKIDRSFVRGMATDPRSVTIVRATTDLAHSLGFRVAAEGVEDAAALLSLGAMGCDMVQGYAIARPAPPEQLDVWLRDAPWHPRPATSLEPFGSAAAAG